MVNPTPPGFWQGRRVFVTGHTGFKGSWLSLWLGRLGAQVTGYALAPDTQPSLFGIFQAGQPVQSVIGDVRDPQALARALRDSRAEIVFHLAAQPLVRRSYDNPAETYATNVMGTVHLLDAVRSAGGVRAVVVVTSDKCYENREWPWGYRESDPMGGHDPYSSSKGCTELVAASYRSSFFPPADHARHGVALATARAGNVVGGGDWSDDRLVPDLVRAFAAGQPAVIRNPLAVRPWQHVLEPLQGYLMLAERLTLDGPAWGEAWNFGPQDTDARPVSWVADQLARHWGDGARWAQDAGTHPHEAHLLRLDSAKAHQRLGWRPRWRLEHTLENIAGWYGAHLKGQDMLAVSLAQVRDFENTNAHG